MITDKLITLNVLRQAAGKPALKSWKESKAKLDAAIAALTSAKNLTITKVPATSPELVKEAKRQAAVKSATDKVMAKKDKTPATKRTPTATKSTKKLSGTKSTPAFFKMLEELGIEQKQARATLRRKEFAAPYDATPAVRAALTTDARKK